MTKYWIILSLLFPLVCQAQGDITAGKIKSQYCAACHETRGVNKLWAYLQGQHAPYLVKQLEDYKAKTLRRDPLMTAVAGELTRQDMEDLAAYYASLPLPSRSKKNHHTIGEKLYKTGDASKHIIACIACHGPDAKGNAQAGFPALAGQDAAYTIRQMNAFKKEKRKNDVQEIMRDISKRMNQTEIEALAYYLEGL